MLCLLVEMFTFAEMRTQREAELKMERIGLEPATSSLQSCEQPVHNRGSGALSGDLSVECSAGDSTSVHRRPDDADETLTREGGAELMVIIERWPTLPEATRRALLAVVEAAG